MHRNILAAAFAAVVLAACAGNQQSRDATASQARAAEQAPSVSTQEGAGGKNPRPLPQREADGPRYSGDERGAQEPGLAGRTPETQASRGVDSGNEVNGRIASVDAQNHEIALDTGGATTQFRVADDAEITVNGERAGFEQLRQGVEVRASLDRSGDVPTATRVEATSKQQR